MKQYILAFFFALYATTISAAPTITFFFRPYPTLKDTPSTKSSQAEVSGIFVTYAGQLANSNSNGQVKFLRKQTNPSFSLLIIDKVTPILRARNTIHHWKLETDTPAALYRIEKKYDHESKTHYWQTKKSELPKNDIMPLETILIFAKPENIYVPEGITVSDENSNLILPDVYVKNSLDNASHSLYVLNIKNLFKPINLEYKKNGARYSTIIEE